MKLYFVNYKYLSCKFQFKGSMVKELYTSRMEASMLENGTKALQ